MGRPTSHDRDVRGPGNSVFRREVAGTGSVGDSGRFSGPRRSGRWRRKIAAQLFGRYNHSCYKLGIRQ